MGDKKVVFSTATTAATATCRCYIFAGEHLLCARQRTSNQDAAAGSVDELARIVKRLGLARNERLRAEIEDALAEAAAEHEATGRPARRFTEFEYQTLKSWSRARRVGAKAEQLEGKENPRFVVTVLSNKDYPARRLCAGRDGEPHRGAVELVLRPHEHADGAGESDAFVFFGLAYTLMLGLRRLGLEGAAWARMQTETLRRRLLKMGTRVRVTARRAWLSLAES